MTHVVTALVILALLCGCQRDDEIAMAGKFAACKVQAMQTVPDSGAITLDPSAIASTTKEDTFLEACMTAAGYRRPNVKWRCDNLLYQDNPALCFIADGCDTILIPTEFQDKSGWQRMHLDWIWLKRHMGYCE